MSDQSNIIDTIRRRRESIVQVFAAIDQIEEDISLIRDLAVRVIGQETDAIHAELGTLFVTSTIRSLDVQIEGTITHLLPFVERHQPPFREVHMGSPRQRARQQRLDGERRTPEEWGDRLRSQTLERAAGSLPPLEPLEPYEEDAPNVRESDSLDGEDSRGGPNLVQQ
jgi:hypothetical protein